jgi:hypothetical protein
MPRSVLAGFTAIVVLTLGSLAYVFAVTSAPSSAGTAPPAVVAARPEVVVPPPAKPPVSSAPAPQPQRPVERHARVKHESQPPPAEPSPPPAPAPAAAERALRDAAALAGLEAVSSELIAGMSDLRLQLALCGGNQGRASDAAVSGFSGTELTLSLQTTEGAVRIVDAHVSARGEASAAQVECVRSLLTGQTVLAPGVHAGHELEMPFALQ